MTSFINKLAGQEVSDYHLIVTSHPYLVELGLGMMTTGTLYDWWNQHTSDGLYLNRMAVNGTRSKAGLQNPTNGVDVLLGIADDTEFFWHGWKPHATYPNTGRYQKQNLHTLAGNKGGDYINAWSYVSLAGSVIAKDVILDSNHQQPVIGGYLEINQDFKPYYAAPQRDGNSHPNDVNALANISPIHDIINLNRYMASFKDYYPRSLWEDSTGDIGGLDRKKVFASHELLTEIKSSKIGPYLEWSSDVTFYVNDGGGTVACPITERVSFKLYLFDAARSQSENKALTVKNLTYVAPKRDVTGRPFSTSADGGYREPNDNRSTYGSSEIDVAYNSVTKRWEGGTPQLFAKLVTDIDKPYSMPSVKYFLDNKIEQDLDSNSYDGVKVIPATGIAMPIRPQNGNPHQWQPNYRDSEEARCGKGFDKETLVVYNFNTRRAYEADEEVLLSRIDGVWQVFPLWDGAAGGGQVVSAVNRWGEFSYLMTNNDYFFRKSNGGRFTPRDAELSFHMDYYSGTVDWQGPRQIGAEDPLWNKEIDYGISGGYNASQHFSTKGRRAIVVEHAYAQQTSFDYLDTQLFGIRSKEGVIAKRPEYEDFGGGKWIGPNGLVAKAQDRCSISTTSAVINSAGHAIPPPNPNYLSRNAAHAGVFFGCMFPAGYLGVEPYLENRDWDVVAKSIGDEELVKVGDYFFTKSGNRNSKPFGVANATYDRNNCRCPTLSNATGVLGAGQDGGGNRWSRHDPRASANLFAEYFMNGSTSFKQIPADVMTNASPKGKNGSPLQPVGRFKNFHRKPDSGEVLAEVARTAARAAFLHGVWLAKGHKPYLEHRDWEDDSAFDFAPVIKSQLTFRPCKIENYVQFAPVLYKRQQQWALDLTEAGSHDTVRGFCSEAARTQRDSLRPCSYSFEDREQRDGPRSAAKRQGVRGDHVLWDEEIGLKWGDHVANKISYYNLHEYGYWDRDHWGGAMWWTWDMNEPDFLWGLSEGEKSKFQRGWRGAGAYGIITAFTTVSANVQIGFTTDNIYGMGPGTHGKFTIQNGFAGQDHTWGVNLLSESYRQENILDLSVRIYHQHPRDQTLFDPRTYAVHHFNPNVRWTDDIYTMPDGSTKPLDPIRFHTLQEIDSVDQFGDAVSYTYVIPTIFSTVDFQEICRYEKALEYEWGDLHANGVEYNAIPLEVGSYILSDATMSIYESQWGIVKEIKGPVAPAKYWKINTVRVGKLLPFRYNKREVAIPIAVGAKFDIGDETVSMNASSLSSTAPYTPVQDILDVMIVKNPGTGYVEGDLVTSANNISFRVERASVPGGIVEALECLSRGDSFKASQSAGVRDTFNPDTEGKIKISDTNSAKGKDFDAYFVATVVYEKLYVDPKPFLMTRDGEEIVRIASNVSQGTHDTYGFMQPAQAGAFVDGSADTTFVLDPEFYSENKQYDVFFHFHNDITMTWLASTTSPPANIHGDRQNATANSEQHITVKINPL